MDLYYQKLFFGPLDQTTLKIMTNSNKRSSSRMETTLSQYNRDKIRTYSTISRQQELFVEKQSRILPILYEENTNQKIGTSRQKSATFTVLPSCKHQDVRKQCRRRITIRDVRELAFENKHLDDKSRLCSPNTQTSRNRPRSWTPQNTAFGVKNCRNDKAQIHWKKIKENLKYLIFLDKERKEDQRRTQFSVSYNKLRQCRYLRYTKDQLDENEHCSTKTCFCNTCSISKNTNIKRDKTVQTCLNIKRDKTVETCSSWSRWRDTWDQNSLMNKDAIHTDLFLSSHAKKGNRTPII